MESAPQEEENVLTRLPDDVHRIISDFYQYTYQPIRWSVSFNRMGDEAELFASLFQVEIWCQGPIELGAAFNHLYCDEENMWTGFGGGYINAESWEQKLATLLNQPHPCSIMICNGGNACLRIGEDVVGIWPAKLNNIQCHHGRPFLFLHSTHPQFRSLRRDILEGLHEMLEAATTVPKYWTIKTTSF